MTKEPVDFEEALKDPSSVFDAPGDVVDAPGLERAQRIEILKRWDSDARQLMAASDENMAGGEHQQLQAVHEALRSLGVDPHQGAKDTGSKFR
jgi:hypothetical protein